MQSTKPTHIIIIWLSLTSEGVVAFLYCCVGMVSTDPWLGDKRAESSYQLVGMKVSALYLVVSESFLLGI